MTSLGWLVARVMFSPISLTSGHLSLSEHVSFTADFNAVGSIGGKANPEDDYHLHHRLRALFSFNTASFKALALLAEESENPGHSART
jgi:hypothetical protein